jgi:hypothetical protein
MPVGPGKYDAACTKALVECEAHTVVLIVLGGKHGTGFSLNSTDPTVVAKIPDLLRAMADQIEGVS